MRVQRTVQRSVLLKGMPMKASESLLKRLAAIEQEELGGGNTLVTLTSGAVIAIKPRDIQRFCSNAMEEASTEATLVKDAVSVEESDNRMFTLISMCIGNAIER
jgi:hypothetical protein